MRRLALVTAGLCVAAAVLWVLRWTTPSYIELTGAIPAYGAEGEAVAGRVLSVKVDRIRLANRITFDRYGKRVSIDTGGVFAIVSLEAAAVSDTTAIGAATWVGPSGRRYWQTQRLVGPNSLLINKPLQPGLPRKGIVAFELPADEVDGGELRIARLQEPRLDSEIRVRLDTRYVAPATPLEISDGG